MYPTGNASVFSFNCLIQLCTKNNPLKKENIVVSVPSKPPNVTLFSYRIYANIQAVTQHNLKLNFNDGTRSDGPNFKCEFHPIRIISYETQHTILRRKKILYTRQIHMIQHVVKILKTKI
jgi:hypothetical protein